MSFTPDELVRLRSYLQTRFKNEGFMLKIREKAEDSVEVILDNEFIGVIYKDTEENEVSYDFNMAILDIDLPQKASA